MTSYTASWDPGHLARNSILQKQIFSLFNISEHPWAKFHGPTRENRHEHRNRYTAVDGYVLFVFVGKNLSTFYYGGNHRQNCVVGRVVDRLAYGLLMTM